MTHEQINNVPQKMKDAPRWVGFMLVWDENKCRNTKIPINPRTLWSGSSTNPESWASFEVALAAIGKPAHSNRIIDGKKITIHGEVNGVGLVLGDGFCGIDLDHCVEKDGKLASWASDIVTVMDGTYTEYSVSGTGLHLLFWGAIPTGRNKSPDNNIEMYATGRFFTMTGNGAGNLEERTIQAAAIFDKYLAPVQSQTSALMQNIVLPAQAEEPDDALLTKMFAWKNGQAIRALWNGDVSAYGGDDSRADSAMVMHLLHATQGNQERTGRLFRRCALMRPKWDEKRGTQTYGELTISRAAAIQTGMACQRPFASMAGTQMCCESSMEQKPQTLSSPVSEPHEGIAAIDPLSDEKRFGWNDMGVGLLFAETYKSIARYVPQAESWYVYDGHVWKIDTGNLLVAEHAKALVRYMITRAANIPDDDKRERYMKFLAKMNSNKARSAMLESAKSIYPIAMSQFDKNPYLFNCRNGTFDLQNFRLLPHRAADFISKIANVEYRPNVTCSRWDEFVDEIMECDIEKAAYLQTAIGYGLTGLQNQKCFFILHGQKTNNGKSTFMDAILHIMGDYAKAAQADVITSKQFARDSGAPSEDVARLWGARLVSMAEPDKSARLNVGLLKQMTGNDLLTARFLRQNSFQFVPGFKIFLHANDLPQTTDDTIFSSGRVKVIEFNREFKPEEQDRALSAFFNDSVNASGIFNWMLEGAQEFLSAGLKDPLSVQSAVAAYRAESDIIGEFIGACVRNRPETNTLMTKVYESYRVWCSACGYQPMSLKNLTREFKRRMAITHGRNGNYITGVCVNDSHSAVQFMHEQL